MDLEIFKIEKEKTKNKVPIKQFINFNENEKNIKVSVIVPVYNVQEYLKTCLDSILNQTLREIEIICVNDGSTDNSLNILKDYASQDSRVKIIDKENAGYGHVMNIGMDMASGKYLGIVESDDYILPKMFERYYEVAEKNQLDFVKSDFYRFYGQKNYLTKEYNQLYSNKDIYNKIICPREDQRCFLFIMNTWCGIYNTNFIRENNIRHNETEGASFQDNGFWFKSNVFADRTMYLNEPYYMNRRDNPNSSVKNPKKIYCANEEYHLITEFLERKGIKEQFLDVLNLKKYHNYNFTLERIAPKFRKEYLHYLSKEYQELEDKGELFSKFFSLRDLNIIKSIINDPDDYYYTQINKGIKISVILPVYNVEKYLDKCLNSLINQTFKDFEIICINDGSKDNSTKILDYYQAIDQRIKILNQENKGAGSARNWGMSVAEGDYLIFLEADDFFDKDMLKETYEKAIETNSDICICGYYSYDNFSGSKVKCNYSLNKDLLHKDNIFNNINCWTCNKLYKRKFIVNNQLLFQELRTFYDMHFGLMSLILTDKISIIDKYLYYHRINVPSSLSQTRELSWKCFYYALLNLKKELQHMRFFDKYEKDFVNYALKNCLSNFNSLKEPYSKKLFNKLRESWFDTLGITVHNESFFISKEDYKQYKDIMDIPINDVNAYYSYQVNYWKDKYQIKINEYPIKLNKYLDNIYVEVENDKKMTISELKNNYLWNRNERLKYIELLNSLKK